MEIMIVCMYDIDYLNNKISLRNLPVLEGERKKVGEIKIATNF